MSRFESTVVAFDPVVRVLRGVVSRVGQQLRDHGRQRSCAIGDNLLG
jgi:hypothetical protein